MNRSLTYVTRNYYLLTKPGIIFGNLITTAGGIALASRGVFALGLLLATLVGLGLVIASACVFNNCIDREADAKMARTQHRPLAKGAITPKQALFFAAALGVMGASILAHFTHLLTVSLALIGLIVYVVLYSFSKYVTVHHTLIGSIAGAIPPIVGYSAVSHHLDLGAWIFFAMLVFWQMPHFYAIAIYRLEDYAKASIPLLPVKWGVRAAKIQILLYILAFTGTSSLLTVYGYTGITYLMTVIALGIGWTWLALQGFECANDQRWAKKMFFFSLIVIMALCGAITLTA